MSTVTLTQQIADLQQALAKANERNYQANLILDHAVTLVDRLVDKYREERERPEKKRLDALLDAYFG